MTNGGLLALLMIHGVYRSSASGVITVSERLSSEAIINKGGGHKIKYNAQTHDLDCNGDVHGCIVWTILFKRSILHLKCKFKLQLIYR